MGAALVTAALLLVLGSNPPVGVAGTLPANFQESNGVYSDPCPGAVDEVRIYNRALSQARSRPT
jgi:hypothetical protein